MDDFKIRELSPVEEARRDELFQQLGKAYFEGAYEDPLPQLLPLFDELTALLREPEPEPEPAIIPDPTIVVGEELKREPVAEPESIPFAESEPAPEPVVEPAPEPVVEPAPEPAPAPFVEAEPVPAAGESPMCCPECGVYLPPGASFCEECGHKIIREPAPVERPKPKPMFCPKCGSKLRDGIMFCGKCGTKIR